MTVLEYAYNSTVEIQKHNAADVDVAYAAWVSNFASEARNRPLDRVEGLIKFLWRENHTSPFEHGSFTYFVDTPLFVAREFMRHRTWSYNETSGRYMVLKPRFYLPPPERPLIQVGSPGKYTFVEGTPEQYELVVSKQEESFIVAWSNYEAQLDANVAKEVARNVLPLATMTQFYATANPLNVMRFLTLRNDKNALYEIRAVAEKIEEEFASAMPLTYKAFDSRRKLWRKLDALMSLIDEDELDEIIENVTEYRKIEANVG